MRGSLSFVLAVFALGVLVPFVGPSTADAGELTSDDPLTPPPPTAPKSENSPGPIPTDPPFSPNVRASEDTTPGNQNEITMAVASDGRIHMGWNDARDPNPDYRCGYSYSTDGGLTWSANQLLHLDPWQADGDPVVIVDSNDTLYFVCMPFNRPPLSGSRIVVYKSTDGGVTFAPPVIASDTTLGFNDKPWAHAVGTTIHVCYAHFVGGGTELRYTRSTDGGVSWAATRILDRNGNGCVFASTAAGMMYLGWVRGGAIVVLASPDGGTTWSSPRFAGPAPFTAAGDQRAGPLPAIAADWNGGNVYVVWTADDGLGTWDVRFSRSTNDGVTWSSPATPSDDTTGRQFMPGIDVDASGTVHVSWYDNRTGLMSYRTAASLDGGLTWLPSLRVTDTEWFSLIFIGDYTTLVADDFGYVNCGWADARSGEVEAYFSRASWPGSPRLVRIEISPAEAWTDADTSVRFTATGYDQLGNIYPTNPSWEATGGTVSAGVYVPEKVGDWRVWANESGVSGTAEVHVSPGALTRIDVSPAGATVTADDTLQFTASGFDAHDNAVAISPSWAATNGAVSSGLFTPHRVGSWIIYANESSISGAASVTVAPGALARISVSPSSASLTADQTLQFTASAYDSRGNVVTIAPTWSATNGSVLGGLFMPYRVGMWTVSANVGSVSGSASVTVLPGALASIVVTPSEVTMTADEVRDFDAVGFDSKGNLVAISPVWRAGGGAIDSEGRYAADIVGFWSVTAEASGISSATTVVVTPGILARIDVSPAQSVVTADDPLAFTAIGFDADGNIVSVAPVWSTEWGAISSSGVYTPSLVGTYLVWATMGGIVGEATVTVLPGALTRIVVEPPQATISADAIVDFVATGFDGKGNRVDAAFAWAATCGIVTASGRFNPVQVGTCLVSASASGISGDASVTVFAGILARIDVMPSSITLTADDTTQFTAIGFDAKGNEVPVTPDWEADRGTIDTAGLYAARLAGEWGVRAMVGPVIGVAHVTVVPGALHRLDVVPDTVIVRTHEFVTFSAVGFDEAGNEVELDAVSWASTNGTVDEGRFEPWRTGVQQVFASVGSLLATATATVHPGPVASVVVSPESGTVRDGEVREFEALAYDAKGNVVEDALIAWSVEGGIGTVDANGVFTATTGGTGRVVAAATGGGGSARMTARVEVLSLPIALIPAVAALLTILGLLVWRRRRRRDRAA